jgi:2-polyprenyl-3-methyl-5-hydroxy-6-metoxy-1,4-benzoquinol methylase
MPVLRINNYIDAYRIRAANEDLHELAARPNKKAVTEFVNRRILEALTLTPEDVLVDIGCGDASLLRMAEGSASKCVGIVASVEEKLRLESSFANLSFVASSARELAQEAGSATKVVCNTTLLYLPSEDDVRAALREMSRIAKPGAMIWVGEIPEIDEYAHYEVYRGNSMVAYLWHLLKHNGVRTFLGMVRRWLKAVTGSEQIVLNSAGMFYAGPEKMISLAESSGLRLKSYVRHQELDGAGRVTESPFRYDYIFTI